MNLQLAYIFTTFHEYIFPDINECADKADNCHADAKCINMIGTYNCSCNDGYSGNGFHCEGECVYLIYPHYFSDMFGMSIWLRVGGIAKGKNENKK